MAMSRRAVSGFTLIELAVVLAVVSLMVAGAVTSFSAIRTNTQIKETQAVLDRAELLLQAFVARNGRLPCPADPTLAPGDGGYGQESNQGGFYGLDNAGNGCDDPREVGATGFNIFWGTFPATSLGARVQDLADGWNTQLFYFVNGSATKTDSLESGPWDEVNTISLWPNTVMNPGDAITTTGVVALVSVGANRNGGYTLDGSQLPAPPAGADAERENVDLNDEHFVAAPYSDDPDAPFDDIVRVFDEDTVILPLAENGGIRTKRATTLERLRRLNDLIVGFAAQRNGDPDGVGTRTVTRNIPLADSDQDGVGDSQAAGRFPYADFGLSARDVLDAWGMPIRYDPHGAPASTGTADAGIWSNSSVNTGAGSLAFELYSFGPDRTDDSRLQDDIDASVTFDEAIGRFTRAGLATD